MANFREIFRKTLYHNEVGLLANVPQFDDGLKYIPVYLQHPFPQLTSDLFPLIVANLGDEDFTEGIQDTHPRGFRSFPLDIYYFTRPRELTDIRTTTIDMEETASLIEKRIVQGGLQNTLPGQYGEYSTSTIRYAIIDEAEVPYGQVTLTSTIRYMVSYN